VHHVLTVGEIYDKAIDLCLRNAGKIALSLGVFSLVGDTLNVITSRADADSVLKNLHLRVHAATSTSEWLVTLAYVSSIVVFPIIEAALFMLFDHGLRDETISLMRSICMPFRRVLNVIIASLVAALYCGAPVAAIALIYFIIVGLTQLRWSS
jgi:hypothetical protein